MTSTTKVLFCLIVVLVATLSWAFVEQPFRKGPLRPGRRALLQVNGWTVGLLTLASLALLFFHGFPNRFPIDAQQVAVYAAYDRSESTREGVCFLDGHNKSSDLRQDICLTQHPGKKSILLMGDSHAAQLFAGLAAVFPDRDILQADVAGCRPFLVEPRGVRPDCREWNSFVFNNYLLSHHVDTLVLGGQWVPGDLDRLTQTIEFVRAHGVSVVLVGPAIEYDQALPRMLAIAIRSGHLDQIEKHRSLDTQQLDETMADLANTRWHIPYVSIYQDLCTPMCPLYAAPGVPLLFDSNHFTAEGSVLLARRMVANKQIQ